MCCDICHKYDDCDAADRLKENCCRLCREYASCYSEEEREEDGEEMDM